MDIKAAAELDTQVCTGDDDVHPRANRFAGTSLPWLAIRPEYRTGTDGLRGVAILAFGVGEEGASWLRKLEASAWFGGLQPNGADLLEAGADSSAGYWMPSTPVAAWTGAAGLGSYTVAPLPRSILATLALPAGATDADAEAAFELVRFLRARRVCGQRPCVLVTSDAEPGVRSEVLHRRLREAGAFLVTPWPGTPVAHLHGFALRAAIEPRDGRLICVDLADHFVTWPSGGAAVLRLCDDMQAAHAALRNDPDRMTSVIHWHVVPGAGQLIALDRLGQHAVSADGASLVLTTAGRIDGTCGTMDLLCPLP